MKPKQRSKEYQTFNDAMNTLLRADPKAVKADMERDAEAHAEERKAKGERKRGKKTSQQKLNSAI